MRVTSVGQLELVEDGDHPGLGVGQLGAGRRPSPPAVQRDPLQRAAPVRDHPGRVGQGGEEVADDPQAGLLPAPAGDLACAPRARTGPSPSRRVRARSPPSRSMITRHRRDPGRGPERLLGGLQRGRPHALEQVADLLDAARRARRSAARGGRPGAAAGPRSHRPVRAGSSAAARSAGRSAPRPCRRSCRWSGPRCVRAHEVSIGCTHTNGIAPLRGELAQHPPPVPGRLTRDRHPGEALRGGAARRPSPTRHPRSQALHRNVRRASTFESWSVTTTICLRVGQVDPDDRVRRPAPAPAAAPAERCGSGHPETHHYRWS